MGSLSVSPESQPREGRKRLRGLIQHQGWPDKLGGYQNDISRDNAAEGCKRQCKRATAVCDLQPAAATWRAWSLIEYSRRGIGQGMYGHMDGRLNERWTGGMVNGYDF